MQNIEQQEIMVCIHTQNYRITGKIHLPPGGRLSDFINAQRNFIPVTEATMETGSTGEKLAFKIRFLNLNKNYIVAIFPLSEIVD